MKTCYKVSVRRACRLVLFRRATFLYKSKRPEQADLRKRIKEIASEKPRYGYRRITILIRREGLAVNTKRVYRIYKKEGLQMRKKVPKRRVSPQLRQVRVKSLQKLDEMTVKSPTLIRVYLLCHALLAVLAQRLQQAMLFSPDVA